MSSRFAVAFAAAACLATAATPGRSEEVDCGELVSNVEMTECQHRHYEVVDKELNRVYGLALASIAKQEHLTATQRSDWEDAFRRAQRSWVAFKEVDCGEMIGWEWYEGSGMALESWTCLVERTEQRTKEIQSRYLGE